MSISASQKFKVHLQQPMQHLHAVATVLVHVTHPIAVLSITCGSGALILVSFVLTLSYSFIVSVSFSFTFVSDII
jgi:hypothetical protein